ncbi:ECF transporter S component [Bacillus sp. DX1.1]|uniref:ECF transporter S component n=1 Tax=unclassified Bacillus (in: firmicutes) TaxID=185979 RepID=UPI002571038C|nr:MULTISPECIES: ECF transporter S component [unclassified Bacillus (in: firmicutes)]MDM5156826.1 ECF transporter S component [Bacillus sp. DX1.1]WJE81073.1 ECF transporter S component [Bacillus sp. DX3.1]
MKLSNKFQYIPLTNVRSIVLVAMLASLTVAGRLIFAFIPNVQPMTAIIIIISLIMGRKYGIIIAILSMILSNLVLGMGWWTISQIIGYSIIALLTGSIMRSLFERIPHIVMSLYAACMGLLYGFIMALWQAPIYGFKYFWAYWLAGIPFDIYHAGGNFGFYFVLAPVLIPLLNKRLEKYYRVTI